MEIYVPNLQACPKCGQGFSTILILNLVSHFQTEHQVSENEAENNELIEKEAKFSCYKCDHIKQTEYSYVRMCCKYLLSTM